MHHTSYTIHCTRVNHNISINVTVFVDISTRRKLTVHTRIVSSLGANGLCENPPYSLLSQILQDLKEQIGFNNFKNQPVINAEVALPH